MIHHVVRDVRIPRRKSLGATPRPFGLRRLTGLATLTAVVAAAVAYLQVRVPLAGPTFARTDAIDYWAVALIAGLVVLIAAAAVAWLSLGAAQRRE